MERGSMTNSKNPLVKSPASSIRERFRDLVLPRGGTYLKSWARTLSSLSSKSKSRAKDI